MTKSTVKAPDPQCPVCKGRGWFQVPTISVEFGPQSDMHPCPDCNPVEPPSARDLIFIVLGILLILGLAVWGGR